MLISVIDTHSITERFLEKIVKLKNKYLTYNRINDIRKTLCSATSARNENTRGACKASKIEQTVTREIFETTKSLLV